jgi:sporulation integral membrane protein YlbJ
MRLLRVRSNSTLFTFLIGMAAILTVLTILLYPSNTLEASTQGLRVWWNMVFPALLPFFILCDIVIAYGISHALGILIDPLLRRLFRLPGIAGWSLISGMLAGSPAGTEAVVKLRQAGTIDQIAAERMMMLTHFANPVFMVTIISVAFLQQPELALFICIIHYISAFGCALLFRNYLLQQECTAENGMTAGSSVDKYMTVSVLSKMIRALKAARQQDQRSFGQILGEAVGDSLQKLMMIGGTIIMFSVLLELISITLSIPSHAMDSTVSAAAEVHIGAYSISQMKDLPMIWKTAAICGMIGWGGLAVHMQVRALVHSTDIRYSPFLLARLVQSMLSIILVFVIWQPYHHWFPAIVPSYFTYDPMTPIIDTQQFWDIYLPWRNSYFVFIVLTIVLAAVIYSSRHESRPGLGK